VTPETDQIEAHIERTRQDLGANLQALEQKIKSATDWRTVLRGKPLIVLGVAALGGVLVVWRLRQRRRRWA
jgi:hypothetical protein